MALRGLVLPIAGDPRALLQAFKVSERAAHSFSTEIRNTGATAEKSARLQVQAAVRTEARLRSEIAEYKRLGQAAVRGSREQVAAARLAAQAQGRLSRSLAVSARESRQLAAAHAHAERGFSRVGRGAIAGSGALRSLGRSIAFASGAYIGSAGLVYGIKASIDAAEQFDTSLSRIIGLAGGSEKQVHRFRGELLQLAPAVGKTPQELAEALYFVSSAGIKAADALGVVKVSAQASSAGLGETQTVADAVTSAINAYGAANLNAQQAADVLTATVREGKGEAAAFAPVIGQVAGFAAKLGVSFNDVGAALAAETRIGVSAQTAAIQLQAVFSALVKTSPQAEKAFKSVGLSSEGLRKELREKGLLAVLRTLKERFGENTAALAQAFPNIRSLRGLFALVGKNAKDVEGVFNRLKDASGSLGVAFGASQQRQAFQFERLKAAIQVTAITIGAAFAPAASRAAAAIANWLGKTQNQRRLQREINNIMRTASRILHGVIAVVRPLAGAVVTLSHALGGAYNVAKLFAAAFIGMKILGWARQFRILAASIRGVAAAEALAGGGGLLGGRGGVVGALGRFARSPAGRVGLRAGGAAGVAAAVLSLGGATEQRGDRRKKYSRLYAVVEKAGRGGKLTAAEQAALLVLGGDSFATASDAKLRAASQALTITGTTEGGGRAAAESPGRAGAAIGTTGANVVARRRGEAARRGRAGGVQPADQIAKAEEQLAKAELTAGTRDDKAALQRLAALTRQKIAKTRDLKERTQLYQQLGGYESQIAQLDKDAAEKAKAKKKEQMDALKSREKTLRDQIKGIQGQFKEAIDTARQGIGELFGGPVLNPAEDARKGILGVRGGAAGPSIKTLTADVLAQNAEARRRQRETDLIVRSAPRALRAQLRRDLGGADLAQIDAIARASPRERARFLRAFGARERLAQNIARATLHARLVTLHALRVRLNLTREQERQLSGGVQHHHHHINIDGKEVSTVVTTHQQRRNRSTATQRRGPSAGRTHA